MRTLLLLALALALPGCITESTEDPADGAVIEVDAEVVEADAEIVEADAEPGEPDAAPSDDCVPYDDQCPEGTYCQYEAGRLTCVAEGEPEYDHHTPPPCPEGRCQRGAICMRHEHDRQPFCYQPCDVNADSRDCSNGRHTCWPAEDGDTQLSFGICNY